MDYTVCLRVCEYVGVCMCVCTKLGNQPSAVSSSWNAMEKWDRGMQTLLSSVNRPGWENAAVLLWSRSIFPIIHTHECMRTHSSRTAASINEESLIHVGSVCFSAYPVRLYLFVHAHACTAARPQPGRLAPALPPRARPFWTGWKTAGPSICSPSPHPARSSIWPFSVFVESTTEISGEECLRFRQ